MRKFILMLFLMASAASCYIAEISEPAPLSYSHHHDDYNVGDTVRYTMDCTIFDKEVCLFFTKRVYTLKGSTDVQVYDKTYRIDRDSLTTSIEEYRYTAEAFKAMLVEKNKDKRESAAFMFSPDMYCTWKFFDEIYIASKAE